MTNAKDTQPEKSAQELALSENSTSMLAMTNVKDIRRENSRALAQAIGGISALAKLLGKAQSQISRLIGRSPTKNIGDKLAAEIEAAFHKPYGWLDREHPGITIPLEEYETVADITPATVPLIGWDEAAQWSEITEKSRIAHAGKRIPVLNQVSNMGFALTVKDESMVAQQSTPTFPLGSIIIVEPNYVPKHGDYVVVSLKDMKEAVLRQWIVKENSCILQPLNARYVPLDCQDPKVVCGVVRELIVTLG